VNDTTGHVSVRYCNPPTRLLYRVASSSLRLVPPLADSFSEVTSGVRTGLHFTIPAFCRIFEAYFS
jgi:hypothetical protein